MAKCIAAISGGLDSVTMGHYLIKENNFDVQAVFIHYGQKHKTLELKYAKQFAENFTKNNLIELTIDLNKMVSHLTALAGDKPMPMSDISDRQATVVPFRNFFILLALSAIAYDTDAVFVAMAINRNDRIIYYDCRPNVLLKILRHVQDCMSFHKKNDTLALLLPFADFTKSQIIQTGSRLGVDFNLTHTCYNGEYPACGTCHSCMDRLSAFRDAGLEDPIIYKVIPKRKGFEFIASLEKNNE